MATYINNLVHSAGGDLARPSKFTLKLPIPASVAGDIVESDMNVLCKTFTVPVIKTEDVDYKFRGHTIPMVGRVVYDHNISVTFILDENHRLRGIFKDWIEGFDTSILGDISTESKALLSGNFASRTSTLEISALNWDEDVEVMHYEFTKVRPVSVSGPEFLTDGVSSVLECTVDFVFVAMSTTKGDKGLGDLIAGGPTALNSLFDNSSETVSSDSDGYSITHNQGGSNGGYFAVLGGN